MNLLTRYRKEHSVSVSDPSEEDSFIHYYAVESGEEEERYSLRVIRKNRRGQSCYYFSEMTAEEEKAKELLILLAENTVYPEQIPETAEEWESLFP